MLTGHRIAELRQKENLTQQQLADMLFVTQPLVSLWERGERRPDYRTASRMAEIFGIGAEEICPCGAPIAEELSGCLPEGKDIPAEKLTEYINLFIPSLSEKERFIFLRRYYLTDGINEISEKTGIKENGIRAVLSKVRKKLKKYLSEAVR